MKMNTESLGNHAAWEAAGVSMPRYDVHAMIKRTCNAPIWVHFGAGNIFRGFIASLQQRLLNEELTDTGIIAVETFDRDIIEKIYRPFDNLTMNVILNPDATVSQELIASVAEALTPGDKRLGEVFEQPGLCMASFTITEKGYALYSTDGNLLPAAAKDMSEGPERAEHAMGVAAALLLKRYSAGAMPVAMVSMDNCSHNGEKLKSAIMDIAGAWVKNGFADAGFVEYISNGDKVSFPWSMIDKITPRPAEAVEDILAKAGIEDMTPVVTDKGTYIAPFVNAERPQYLVIEDSFPNGRPPLEKAGVYMASRDVVNRVERMKVTTCLNPLHTAMSVYGCLLGYTRISEEMKDSEITALIRRLGYVEGLPVVTDPGIISPKTFLDEVVNERLPNPFMPDDPRRIATDTSQKVGIRFGETIKSYIEGGRDLSELVAIPLAIAGWLRYLLAVNDMGQPMELSPDPMLKELTDKLSGITWNDPDSYSGQLGDILSNAGIFGSDLSKTALADVIGEMFKELLAGTGAVRRVLQKYLA